MWLKRLYQGRLDRINYFFGIIYLLGYLLCSLILFSFLGSHLPPSIRHWITIPLLILWNGSLIIFGFSLSSRRYHDFGRSGGWCLLSFLPIVNLIAGLILLFIEGNLEENKYGKPLQHEINSRTILAISHDQTQQPSKQQSTLEQGEI